MKNCLDTGVHYINQEWIGGEAYSTLFIDFRGDSPKFIKIEDEFGFGRINGIATLPNGIIIVRAFDDGSLRVLNGRTFFLEDYLEGDALEVSEAIFSEIPDIWNSDY